MLMAVVKLSKILKTAPMAQLIDLTRSHTRRLSRQPSVSKRLSMDMGTKVEHLHKGSLQLHGSSFSVTAQMIAEARTDRTMTTIMDVTTDVMIETAVEVFISSMAPG